MKVDALNESAWVTGSIRTDNSAVAVKDAKLISGEVATSYTQRIGQLSVIGEHAGSITQLRLENKILQEKLQMIENRLSTVESLIPKEKIVVIKDIPYEDAKKEIKKLFLKGQTLYYSDISQELGISLQTVVEICNALHNNGEIAIDG
ncbi:MAG: hypothetical protein WC169_00955 [Dehalococcoidia bacterium]|jgi:DNA invertase Pin-like site-specific DNA recombinase